MNIIGILTKINAKNTLKYAFRTAGIYASKRNSGGKEIRIYPKIHDVDINPERTRYVFTLPNGFDPKEVAKKEFTFRQVFGRSLELKGDLKRYVLTVYNAEMTKEFVYRYAEIKNVINTAKLPILCGKDRNGQIVWYDMRDLPHILIGGRTGSGKSTHLRQLLTTLILQMKPSDLELYLADCKKAEFHVFKNIEHVKANVVTKSAITQMLAHISNELEKRSDLLEVFGVAHIDDLPKEHKRPYIVLCIDEFVMLRREKDIMDKLIDLTALGRALGIFVILSMQRPVKDVIDTTARSNLNVAMGFRVRDAIEARVLSTPGSEKIDVVGRFYMDINGEMSEIQAPLMSLDECKKLLEPYRVAPSETKVVYEDVPEVNTELLTDDIFGRWNNDEETR